MPFLLELVKTDIFNFAAAKTVKLSAKNGQVISNFSAAKNGQVSSNSEQEKIWH